MSFDGIVRGKTSRRLAGAAVALCLASGTALGADFDKKPNAFALTAPTAKDALSDGSVSITAAPPTSSRDAGRSLPQGLPGASAPTAKSVVKVDNLPSAPGPLGMKTPQPVVDATHQKPDYWPMLPGIFGKPDNNVGMVLGVVLPIESKDK
jgi:hypothetical protein